IYLILIHEVSFNPKCNCNLPFSFKLYNRINCVHLMLENMNQNGLKLLRIPFKNSSIALTYNLIDNGFKWINVFKG
ncbi:MAG: hypothetical protein ACTSQG_10220, partial [Promethearchaeota archaeon]